VRTTIVTGGHSHEPSFYGIFDGVSWLQPQVDPHPVAYRRDLRKSTDVLVLYDMVQEIPDGQRANLRAFLESGKGLVILHHAVADFQKWEWWWKEVMGVKYVLTAEEGLPASTFRHDVRMKVEVVAKHPVTRGIAPMFIEDETYKGMWFAPGNQVLMRTDEASSDGPVVWISPYRKSRVVVIQLGHGSAAHRHPGYVDLVRNAVRWAGGRE
jgi:type 1 glutamine amidotransferase